MGAEAADARALAVRRALADVPPTDPIVVACSGGADSLALASAAVRTGRPVVAAVVDHGLQPGSAQIAEQAAARCRELGIDRVDILTVAVTPAGQGLEAAARDARRAVLRDHAARAGASVILLGHTRDDQAETVLLRLARGSGARSLAAMAPRDDVWRRPFLGLGRDVVRDGFSDAWADPYNDDPRFARTRVRQCALPALVAALGPGVVVGLARSAELLRDDADALDAIAAPWTERWSHVDDHAAEIPIDDLVTLPRAVRTRVLRAAILAAGSPPTDLTREHVLEVDRLVVSWRGQGAVSLPAGVEANRRCGRLRVSAPRPAAGR